MEIGETVWQILVGTIIDSSVSDSTSSDAGLDQFMKDAFPPDAGLPKNATPGNSQLSITTPPISLRSIECSLCEETFHTVTLLNDHLKKVH